LVGVRSGGDSLDSGEAPDGASPGFSVANQNAAGLDAGLKLHEDPPFPRRLGSSEAPSLAYAGQAGDFRVEGGQVTKDSERFPAAQNGIEAFRAIPGC
jgi:hypothetical protein